MNHLPQATENNSKVISKFFEKSQRYLQVTTLVANLTLLSTTPALNFATGTAGYVDTSGKFSAGVNCRWCQLPPVSLTPVVNLPLVSTTLVANNWNNIRLLTP
jgi:hypothetical protein